MISQSLITKKVNSIAFCGIALLACSCKVAVHELISLVLALKGA